MSEQTRIILQEITEMQAEDPDLSFADAWNRLRRQRPALFALSGTPSDGAHALARAQVGRELKDAVDDLRSFYPGMNTSQLFSLARQQNPALFVKAARIENGETPKARLVRGVNDYWWTRRPSREDYIMIRAEDADELERQVAAGWWS